MVDYLLRVASEQFNLPVERIVNAQWDVTVLACRGCVARTMIRHGMRYHDVAVELRTTPEGVSRALQSVNLALLDRKNPQHRACRKYIREVTSGMRGVGR